MEYDEINLCEHCEAGELFPVPAALGLAVEFRCDECGASHCVDLAGNTWCEPPEAIIPDGALTDGAR